MLWIIIVPILLASCAQAQRVMPGSCPTIPTEDSFDSIKFHGHWIETEKTPSIFDFVMRCMTATYGNDKGGALSVLLKGVSIGGVEIKITGDGVIHDTSRNAVYNVRYVFGVPFQGTQMTVVDTDYSEYAVLFSCTNSLLPGVFHTEYVWILTRDGVLSNPSRQNIYTKLDQLKINRNHLQMSNRSNCPALNKTREEEPTSTLPKVDLLSSIPKAPAAPVVPVVTSSKIATVGAAIPVAQKAPAVTAVEIPAPNPVVNIVKAAAAPTIVSSKITKPTSLDETNNVREEEVTTILTPTN